MGWWRKVLSPRSWNPESGPEGTRSDSGPPGSGPRTSVATETDVSMMRRALVLAREAAAIGEVPVGAVVYETASGRVLGEGCNRREVDRDPAAHAELLAIRAAAAALGDWRLNGCTLVVTLEPCAMCSGLIVNARLGRLIYGAADPKAGATDSLYRLTSDPRLNHRVEPIAGVLAEECGALLKEFFRGLRTGARRGP
jgi:tRNA(adenine34) deaminase